MPNIVGWVLGGLGLNYMKRIAKCSEPFLGTTFAIFTKSVLLFYLNNYDNDEAATPCKSQGTRKNVCPLQS
jgi:hypothetical protein